MAIVKCSRCDETFADATAVWKHLAAAHSKAAAVTDEARQQQQQKEEQLKQTQQTQGANENKPFSCQDCGKTFATNGGMLHHAWAVHGDGAIIAKMQPSDMHALSSSMEAVRLNEGETTIHHHDVLAETTCGVCGKTFRERVALRQHEVMKGHEGDRVREFGCGACGRGFWTRGRLLEHQRAVGHVEGGADGDLGGEQRWEEGGYVPEDINEPGWDFYFGSDESEDEMKLEFGMGGVVDEGTG